MKAYRKLHRFLETEDRYYDYVKFLQDGGETDALTGDQIAEEVASLAATDPTLAMPCATPTTMPRSATEF